MLKAVMQYKWNTNLCLFVVQICIILTVNSILLWVIFIKIYLASNLVTQLSVSIIYWPYYYCLGKKPEQIFFFFRRALLGFDV